MKKLLVIMVTHRRIEYTKRTLQSILGTTPDFSQCDVVIVDNDSQEEKMTRYLGEMFVKNQKVTVIFNPENNGWAAANNLVLKSSINWGDYEYILFSNNDVEYTAGWLAEVETLYQKYGDKIGILGLWKHTNHGVVQDLGDLIVKDDMPACCWVIRPSIIEEVGEFTVKGVCKTRGGNGEDTTYAKKVQANGYWVCGPKDDIAEHLDKYDNSGGLNPAYQ